jgi:glycosyltransferase involved in cell wall biosynthesis
MALNMKRILYDLTFVGDGRVSGVERFAIEISENLVNDNETEITLAVPKGFRGENKLVNYVYLPFKNKMACHLILPFYIFLGKYDAVLLPAFPPVIFSYFSYLFGRCEFYRVVHDVVYWQQKSTIPNKAKLYLKPLEEFWLSRYKKVITVSEYSKLAIENVLGLKNVTVCPNGVSSVFLSDSKVKRRTENFRIISVGTIEPRKNYSFLVDLFIEITKKYPTAELVICGRAGWGYSDLLEKLNSLESKSQIKVLSDLSDEELDFEYQNADFFVYPSLEEGFGIPIVEAMSYGLPVVASNNSAITEVVSKYGILLDSYHVSEWVESLVAIAEDQNRYTNLSQLSVERSKQFSWKESALKMIRLLK